MIAVLPTCTIRNLFAQERITYYQGQTSSSPFKISAHFLFNRGIPSKTNAPLTTPTHRTPATKDVEAVLWARLYLMAGPGQVAVGPTSGKKTMPSFSLVQLELACLGYELDLILNSTGQPTGVLCFGHALCQVAADFFFFF